MEADIMGISPEGMWVMWRHMLKPDGDLLLSDLTNKTTIYSRQHTRLQRKLFTLLKW